VNGRRKNHDSFWFILDGHDGKVKDQGHKVKREYRVLKSEEIKLVLFTKVYLTVKAIFKKSYDTHV